jgi:myo-inositol-1(or 4)-monophosphatase
MNAWDCYAGYVLIEEAGGWIIDPSNWSSMNAGGPVVVGSPGTRADLLRIVEANAA